MNRKKPHRLLRLLAVVVPCVFMLSCKQADNAAHPASAVRPRFQPRCRSKSIASILPSTESIPASGQLERVATGFKWVEGPVWDQGVLYFAEIPSNSIRKWTPGQGVSIVLQPSGYQGSEPYGGPESGSDGMTLDVRGRLTVAGHARRVVYRFETQNPPGPITILADTYKGKQFNSPNDLVYRSDSSIYFTDPPYGLRTQSDADPHKGTQGKRRLSD